MLTSLNIAQNWTTVKESNIFVGNSPYGGVDIFTNGYGNHIIVQRPNELKYFKMNVNGIAIDSIVIENSFVITPSISGDATRLYIVYRKSNETYVKTKYSSNGGISWSDLSVNPENSNASSIESVFSKNKLHITYTVAGVVYYSYYNA